MHDETSSLEQPNSRVFPRSETTCIAKVFKRSSILGAKLGSTQQASYETGE